MYGWQSNEDVARLSTVCKDWLLPSQHVLFRSCSLLSAASAKAFVETAKERLDLMERVQYLVVGLSEDETWPSSDDGRSTPSVRRSQANTSALMVTALRACTSLRHLQVRPLHDSSRDALLSALADTTLETLICSPRLRTPNVDWTGCLFRREDLSSLVLSTLRNFELDAWTVPMLSANGTPIPGHSAVELPPLVLTTKLKTLRLRFDTSDGHLFALLAAAGETLEHADIYMERMVNTEGATKALSFALPSLKELRWTTNPPTEGFADVNLSNTPLFDRVLPHFESLQRLSISATDVSPAVLSLLPPSLHHLEVQAYTYRGPFKYADEMLSTLASRANTFKFETFTVCDSKEVWSRDDVTAMMDACANRGIAFRFVADEEGDTDSG